MLPYVGIDQQGRTPASVTAIDLPRLARLVNCTVEELKGGLRVHTRRGEQTALVASARVVSRSDTVAFAPKEPCAAAVGAEARGGLRQRTGYRRVKST